MCTNSSFHLQVEDIICVQTETSIWLMLLIYSQIEKQPIVLILSEDRALLWDWFYIKSSQLMLLK